MSNEKRAMSKVTKLPVLTLLLAAAVFAFAACDNNKDTHTHEWEWKVTTVATATADGLETETCKTCGAESGNTRIIAMLPKDQDDTLTDLFNNNTAIIKGYFSNTEWNVIKEKVKTAINAGFVFDTGDMWDNADKEDWFNNVFNSTSGQKATIIVESNAAYVSYKADNRRTLRFNINYLLTASADDLRTAIIAAVTEMVTLPVPTIGRSRMVPGHAKAVTQRWQPPESSSVPQRWGRPEKHREAVRMTTIKCTRRV